MAQQKTCFVTIGATASFHPLIQAALSAPFLSALQTHGYTDLLIQYGQDDGQRLFDAYLQTAKTNGSLSAISVSGFALDKAGLGKYMRKASNGVVISHAGSGTVLDALRTSAPLIVVPNPALLDNHQVELAEALAAQEYVVHGSLTSLPQALQDAEALRERQKAWPPVNSGVHRQAKAVGLKGVLDEEMGFLD